MAGRWVLTALGFRLGNHKKRVIYDSFERQIRSKNIFSTLEPVNATTNRRFTHSFNTTNQLKQAQNTTSILRFCGLHTRKVPARVVKKKWVTCDGFEGQICSKQITNHRKKISPLTRDGCNSNVFSFKTWTNKNFGRLQYTVHENENL